MATQGEARIWTEEGSRKREAVRRMFGEIAPSYDRLNGLMTLSLHRRWRKIAVDLLALRNGETALDLCCGTGDFIPLIQRAVGPTGSVFGADFSVPMLDLAQRKGLPRLALGDACEIPVRDAVVDAVTVGWGIRNVPDQDRAHAEVVRVLRPGGRFVSVDMARPRNPFIRFVSELVFNTFVPVMGAIFGKTQAYAYLPKSTQRFKTREQLEDSMRSAGLVDVFHRDLLLGNVCVHFGRKPEGARSQ
jgi:demethylmenaquinone methyltransferase / 2-methoxy-6-polyprenyl-1,4-benzoquinol methylase